MIYFRAKFSKGSQNLLS